MGKKSTREMEFWTKEEYQKFIEEVMDKPISFYAFEMLYWCGLRMGELLALTPKDFDFNNKTVRINKSYQRIKQKDVITDPKTPKSVRTIVMPEFLSEEMEECINFLYALKRMTGYSRFPSIICITKWTEAVRRQESRGYAYTI
ncbi:MAG: site-specific integrase [Alistipes sp.]|nr:site-specific integrase [Alistipes sp.]